MYPTDYNLMIAQDLWQAYYQFLVIILLKEFIKLYENTDMIIRNLKLAELNIKIASAFANTKL